MQQKRKTLIVDSAVAILLFIISTVTLMRIDIQAIIFSGLITLPLAFRRVATLQSSIFIAAVFIAQAFSGYELLPANVAIIIVAHALASYAPRWASITGLLVAYLGVFIAFWIYDSILFVTDLSLVMRAMVWLLTLALITSAWLLGSAQRARRAHVKELTAHADRLEKEQSQERALAAVDERSRIAREMHDIVAHSLSVIITQADGANYAAKNSPEVARETLATISKTARESLREMRRLLGVLRHDEILELGSLPDLASIPTLLDEVQAVGVKVSFDSALLQGTNHLLPKGAELSAYRVIQEAFTNIIKHAGPDVKASLTLEWDAEGLMIGIIDDGRGAAATPSPEGSGQGIKGMAERIELYGGTVVAHPKIGGGFAVHAWIPYAHSGEEQK